MGSERSDLTSTQGTPGRPERVLLMDLASLLLAGTGVYLYLLDQEGDHGGDQNVVSVMDAGQVLSVTQTSGLLSRSLVETTLGFYAVGQGISLFKDEALTLQIRANQRRYLCDTRQRCTPNL